MEDTDEKLDSIEFVVAFDFAGGAAFAWIFLAPFIFKKEILSRIK